MPKKVPATGVGEFETDEISDLFLIEKKCLLFSPTTQVTRQMQLQVSLTLVEFINTNGKPIE
jgi:hypothetical protein